MVPRNNLDDKKGQNGKTRFLPIFQNFAQGITCGIKFGKNAKVLGFGSNFA